MCLLRPNQPATSATDVAAIVRAMTTNLPEKIYLSADPAAPTRGDRAFTSCVRGVADILRRVFLPHLLAGLGLFALMAYVSYQTFLVPLSVPTAFKNSLAVVFFFIYAIAIFGYMLVAASVFALRLACITWEDFIDDTLNQVQEKMISHLDSLNDSVAKDQAKVLVRGSVREVYESTRRSSTLPRWLITVTLGTLMLAVRAVLTARILKLAGTTIKVSKIFAGKATLVGAVFLNLRFFSSLLLILVYGLGGIVLLANMALVCGW